MKNKVLVIFGTRPEAIKMVPVISNLKAGGKFKVLVCSTGQHKEMLEQVLSLFNIKVDIDLGLMRPNQDLADITSSAVVQLRDLYKTLQPALVLVQGDTTTAFVAALAAFYMKIPIAHVEAGLRSYNILSPYPEEANRRFITTIANLHFAPTKEAETNLLRDGVKKNQVFVTGNTVIDALQVVKSRIENSRLQKQVSTSLGKVLGSEFESQKFILITMHRREKFGKEFEQVLNTIKKLAAKYSGYNFIYAVHLNPNVQKPVREILSGQENIKLIPPQDYLSFVYLMSKCEFILSDSGGIQEECFLFKKPIIVMRDVTERMEAVNAGYAFLVGSSPKKLLDRFRYLESKLKSNYNFFNGKNPFGDGKASVKIAKIIQDKLA